MKEGKGKGEAGKAESRGEKEWGTAGGKGRKGGKGGGEGERGGVREGKERGREKARKGKGGKRGRGLGLQKMAQIARIEESSSGLLGLQFSEGNFGHPGHTNPGTGF